MMKVREKATYGFCFEALDENAVEERYEGFDGLEGSLGSL